VSTADNESKIALLTGTAPLEPRSTDSDLHIAVGAFTLTGCARTSLRCFTTGTLTLPPVPYVDYMYHDPAARPLMPGDSPPQSPACSFASIPSISRTASPFSENETLIPPGWGGRGKGKGKGRERIRAQTLPGPRIHPVLDSLERDSLVGTGWVVCGACNKQGTNFPRCRRCSKMWCSRECRLDSVHRCVGIGAQKK